MTLKEAAQEVAQQKGYAIMTNEAPAIPEQDTLFTAGEIDAQLKAPFDPNQIKQRRGQGGRMLTYIDARDIQRRLDDIVGPRGWETLPPAHAPLVVGNMISVVCSLRILGITRTDYGESNLDNPTGPSKAAATTAFKRAAAQFGIGRYLYDADTNDGEAGETAQDTPNPFHPAARAPTPQPGGWAEGHMQAHGLMPNQQGANGFIGATDAQHRFLKTLMGQQSYTDTQVNDILSTMSDVFHGHTVSLQNGQVQSTLSKGEATKLIDMLKS